MPDAIYALPSDNVAPDATTLTVASGTADAEYPVTNLNDRNLHKPCKLAETSGAFLFAYDVAQHVDIISLGYHNLDAGLDVHVKGNNGDAGGGAWTFDQHLIIPAIGYDGHRVCPFLDMTGLAGHGSYTHWKLAIVGTNTNPIQLTEIALWATKRTFSPNFKWGFSPSEEHVIVEHETDFGIPTVYDLQVRKRTFTCNVIPTDSWNASLLDWHRAMRGRVNPGLFIPLPDVNDAWWVRLPAKHSWKHTFTNYNEAELVFEEVPEGLPL